MFGVYCAALLLHVCCATIRQMLASVSANCFAFAAMLVYDHISGILMSRARRRIVSLVALLSVILHAYALVGHNAMMVQASLSLPTTSSAQSSILAQIDSLSIICRAYPGTDVDAAQSASMHQKNPGQNHNNASSSCPVCSGIAIGHAVIPPPLVVVQLLRGYSVIEPSAHVAITHLARAALPPARGPPAQV
ncbi:MAG: hypothetical protein CTY31_07855 [Hyphomicrobium sp.]|jgi:hypothetical protein|nr:MAG: hypothetical protein CTY39_01530 [Hyphomicrobium sp.]PPC99807.1 MAG: hypothetical protein CTY31_07855 [Hyphomicrobium sp.]